MREVCQADAVSIVWHTGAMLIEQEDDLGRYFDGDSYDGHWDGDPHASTSYLEGDKIIEIWELRDSSWIRKYLTDTTIQSTARAQADRRGQWRVICWTTPWSHRTSMPAELVQASEALAARRPGERVQRRWRVQGAQGQCLGPVRGARVRLEGGRDRRAGPRSTTSATTRSGQPGSRAQWLSPVAGQVTNQPPVRGRQIVQRVGFAPSTSVLNFAARPRDQDHLMVSWGGWEYRLRQRDAGRPGGHTSGTNIGHNAPRLPGQRGVLDREPVHLW